MIAFYETRAELYDEVFPKGAVGAELGVHAGGNIPALIELARPSKLYLCDDWHPDDIPADVYESACAVAAKYPQTEIIRQLDQDWLISLPDGHLDWVYLDTRHTYEHTKLELRCMRGKVKHVIAGHDMCCTAYHDNVCADQWDGGVMLALMEELSVGWLELIAVTQPRPDDFTLDMFPSFACRVIY